VKAGLEREKAALLMVIGAMADGTKAVLAVTPGYRESMYTERGSLRFSVPTSLPRSARQS